MPEHLPVPKFSFAIALYLPTLLPTNAFYRIASAMPLVHVTGLPLLLLPSGTQSNSLLGILESSILLTCPYQLNC